MRSPATAACCNSWLGVCRLLLLLSACVCSAVSNISTQEEELLQWLVDNGATFSATIGYGSDGLRGLVATRELKHGDEIMSIPAYLLLNIGAFESSDERVVLSLLREFKTPCSRLRPFLNSLPKQGEVLDWFTLPLEYLDMLQDDFLEDEVIRVQQEMEALLNGTSQKEYTLWEYVGNQNVTLDELNHIAALAYTRMFNCDERSRLLMVPLADMANHDPGCQNWYEYNNSTHFRVISGHNYAVGDSVCYYYGDLRPDISLVKYGFLVQHDEHKLAAVDHHKFRNLNDFHNIAIDDQFSATTRVQYAAEYARLEARLSRLETLSDQEHIEVVPGKERQYDVLQQWQAVRRAALRDELKRIEEIMMDMEAEEHQRGAEPSGDQEPHAAPAGHEEL